MPESVVVHQRSSTAYVTCRSRLVNAVSPVPLRPTPLERFWQPLCGLRNHLWTERVHGGQGALGAAATTAAFLAKHLLVDDRPLVRARWLLRYARQGRGGRFANVDPAAWAARARRGESDLT